MNTKQKVKYFIAAVLFVAVIIGLVIGFLWIKKQYRSFVETRNNTIALIQFVNIEFPEQSKDYAAKMDELAKQQAQK